VTPDVAKKCGDSRDQSGKLKPQRKYVKYELENDMRFLLSVAAVAILLVGGWFYLGNNADQGEVLDSSVEAVEDAAEGVEEAVEEAAEGAAEAVEDATTSN
jgi:hypothetical protein